jgi:hypothetical protein
MSILSWERLKISKDREKNSRESPLKGDLEEEGRNSVKNSFKKERQNPFGKKFRGKPFKAKKRKRKKWLGRRRKMDAERWNQLEIRFKVTFEKTFEDTHEG